MMRHVLVTGAAGMVGSALLNRMGVMPEFSAHGAYRTQPRDLDLTMPFRVVGEIGRDTYWHDALTGCEAVVHCAARAHVLREHAADPGAAFHEVNVEGTLALAAQAIKNGVRQFVLVSSAGVHGSSNTAPARETDSLHPMELYAISKLEAERRLRQLADRTCMAVTIVRPPLVYGPLVQGNMFRLVDLALALGSLGLPLGAVRNARSFVGVSNLCDAILTILADNRSAGRTYLVSDQNDVSTPELIRMIVSAAGKVAQLWPVPVVVMKTIARALGQGPTLERLIGSLRVDSGAISDELGWRPPMPMQHDVDRMVDWYFRRKVAKGRF